MFSVLSVNQHKTLLLHRLSLPTLVLDGSLFYFVMKWLLAKEDYFVAFNQLGLSSCVLFGSAMMKVDGNNICRIPYLGGRGIVTTCKIVAISQ
jgi:hypothetical protein